MTSHEHGASNMRVLYFTIVPIDRPSGGGSICCRNHVRRLMLDPGIELSVLAAGPPSSEAATREFLSDVGVLHHFIHLHTPKIQPEGDKFRDIYRFAQKMILQTPWDIPSLHQSHVNAAIDHLIKEWSIDVLVIDYSPSALIVKLPRHDVKTCLIKLNREGDFFEDLLDQNPSMHGLLTRSLSLRRWRKVERTMDQSVDQVVVIGKPDIPKYKLRRPAKCITPYLDDQLRFWRGDEPNTALFVGAIGHYPNRLAIEWIATKLAPAVARKRADLNFKIVGVDAEGVPGAWHGTNVSYLGHSDRDALEQLFCAAGAFLCPIKNNYGLKFKMAEALSFRTPLLASPESLLGLPYLVGTPTLDLNDPENASESICRLLGSQEKLAAISYKQRAQHEAFVQSQGDVWSQTLSSLLAK